MMKSCSISLIAIAGLAACQPATQTDERTYLPGNEIKSGFDFLTQSTQEQQQDTFENPGFLWVERGDSLFSSAEQSSPSCADCHDDGLKGVAANYPAWNEDTKTLQNLEARINYCRTEYQDLPKLEYESEDLLSLTAYVSNQSLGMPVSVELSDQTKENYDNGERYFFTRRGQLNLSCEQCHNENWGKKLRGDMISQGHGNGFPAYRFEWQTLGSLHRRLHDCDTGVRAEPYPLGSQTYIDLEFYLAIRASGLSIETPAIRR
ncbi:MAG: sulfur oxidation c-type cytochrome SoxA [Ponticaulis sp.]|nr:sulfur oxidation c-type cytochrome SoxA [Ponticaulis sp.]|tara:strand:+ start:22244 stop:23029 length:786 start_codon:yes stop_codon:yes gene_type:complete